VTARLLLAAVLTALVASSLVPAAARADGACGKPGYAYAGLQHSTRAHGVAATLTVTAAPRVEHGHVAAWIGVGGERLGPDGTTAWIQVGVNSFPDGSVRLYYEVVAPNETPRVVELDPRLAAGDHRRVMLLEVAGMRDAWRVWVDGKAVTEPLVLRGSSGRWRPLATAESWDGGQPSCNRYAFGFDEVRIATAPGGSWRSFKGGWRLQDDGYEVVELSRGSFRTASRG
jgi:hypothetical protein